MWGVTPTLQNVIVWAVTDSSTEGVVAPQIMFKVFAGQRPPVDTEGMPEGFRNLLEDCWASEPSLRPSFKEILGRLRQLLSEERQRRFQVCFRDDISP